MHISGLARGLDLGLRSEFVVVNVVAAAVGVVVGTYLEQG